MKLSEKFKESLIYLFLLCVLSFMLLTGCNVKLSKKQKTQDDKQLEFFKQEIQKRKLNKQF